MRLPEGAALVPVAEPFAPAGVVVLFEGVYHVNCETWMLIQAASPKEAADLLDTLTLIDLDARRV